MCVWPEHEGVAGLVAAEAASIRARLAEAGLGTPDTVSEARSAAGSGWFVGLHPDADRTGVAAALLLGLLPAVPPCVDSAPYPAFAAYWPLAVWLAETAGVGDVFARETGPDERREAFAAVALSADEQLRWFQANVSALRRCGAEPRLLTSR